MSTPASISRTLGHDAPGIIEVLLLTFTPTTVGSTDAVHVASATLYLLPRPRLWQEIEELLSLPLMTFASGFTDTLALCKSPEPALLERWRQNAATSAGGEGWTLCPSSLDVLEAVAFVGADEEATPLQPFASLTLTDLDSLCSLSQLALDEILAFFDVTVHRVPTAPPETLDE